MQTKLNQFIEKVPKAEIHLHLEGCIQLDTLWHLYQENQVMIEGVESKSDLEKLYQIESLEQFISFFIDVLQECVCKAQDIVAFISDLKDYMRRNNVRYAELFLSPSKLIQRGVRYVEIADYLQEGADRLAAEGYICKFLIDVSRSFGSLNAMHNLDNILSYPRPCIIGIGLGGSEQSGPAKDYQEIFFKAKAHGLHCVAHAGEDMDSESIWDSINTLESERIGHGTSAMADPKLREELKKRHIPLEVCITSNLFTKRFVSSPAQHPVRLFYDEGLPLTLNSDDPTLFHSELNDEYCVLVEHCGFNASDVLRIMENNVTMSFMAEDRKEAFIADIRKIARDCQII